MTWNYRIIDHGDHLALHEVFYDATGKPTSFTEKPITFVVDPEEGAAGIVGALEMALKGARDRHVLLASDVVNQAQPDGGNSP